MTTISIALAAIATFAIGVGLIIRSERLRAARRPIYRGSDLEQDERWPILLDDMNERS
jgi:hypothetical protein